MTKISKTGVAWFSKEDYAELKKLFTDGDKLPATYEQWLAKAENLVENLRRDGHIVVKAHIEPKAFAEWCRSRGLNINSRARIRFASEFAALGDGH